MIQYMCPICNKRICDSEKNLRLEKHSEENSATAAVIIKCRNCKNSVAIEVVATNSGTSTLNN